MKQALTITVVLVLSYCSSVEGQDLCTPTQLQGNISYRFHDRNCNEYMQCHRDPNGNTYVVYMSCPFGQHWSQINKRCVNMFSEQCPLGICVNSRMEDGGCRAYTECVSNVRNHTCCPAGHRYMDGRCIPDFTCTDPCPGSCATGEQCTSFPHWENPTFYYHQPADVAYERICPKGSHYDMVQCGCVAPRKQFCGTRYSLNFAGNGTFSQSQPIWTASPILTITNGEASFASNNILRGNVILPVPSFDNPLVIRLTYRSQQTTFPQTLFLSNDCKGCNQLKLLLYSDRFEATLFKYNRDVARVSILTQGFAALVDVAVVYNGRELTVALKSNNLYYMKRTKAPRLTIMDCGMQISDETNPFRGSLSSVAIYSCHQGGRVQDLFNLNNPVN